MFPLIKDFFLDEAKKLIEAAQRQRSADKKEKGEEHLAKYFHATENGWLFSGKSILLNGQEESSEEEKEIQIPSDDEVEVDEQEEEEREKFLEETEKEEPLIQKSRSTSNIPSPSIQNTSSSLNNNSKKRDQLESFTRSPLRRFYKKSPVIESIVFFFEVNQLFYFRMRFPLLTNGNLANKNHEL